LNKVLAPLSGGLLCAILGFVQLPHPQLFVWDFETFDLQDIHGHIDFTEQERCFGIELKNNPSSIHRYRE